MNSPVPKNCLIFCRIFFNEIQYSLLLSKTFPLTHPHSLASTRARLCKFILHPVSSIYFPHLLGCALPCTLLLLLSWHYIPFRQFPVDCGVGEGGRGEVVLSVVTIAFGIICPNCSRQGKYPWNWTMRGETEPCRSAAQRFGFPSKPAGQARGVWKTIKKLCRWVRMSGLKSNQFCKLNQTRTSLPRWKEKALVGAVCFHMLLNCLPQCESNVWGNPDKYRVILPQ